MEKQSSAEVQKWLRAIAAYDNEYKKWIARCEKILKRYRDDFRESRQIDGQSRFNILWSNVNTLIPACYSRVPKADVSRRFKDNDPVGRVAGLILERALDYEITQYPDYRASMTQVVNDRFLPGRGTAWVRYEPHILAVQQQLPTDGSQVTEDIDEPQEQLDYECAPIDYVHWKDFGHTVARTWEEVTAVWRKVYMTKSAKVERFGEELAKKIPADDPPKERGKTEQSTDNDGSWIYEIWNKDTKKAVWIHKSMPDILDEKDDPLGLEEFFPCPRPLYATITNDSLVPVPDFVLYQYQADQLDILSDRIDGLIQALKVMGIYDASVPELARLFTEGSNTQLIPAKNWAAFAEKQGLKGTIDLLELKNIYEALHAAYEAMGQVKEQIHEITGISDIIRGQTQASETATAQQIKGQYASLRLKSMQMQVAQFATECLQLKAQVICGKFTPETILKISAADQLNEADKQFVIPAMQMLQDKILRSFRIDIEADSLVQIDEEGEKKSRTELLSAAGSYLKDVAGAMHGLSPNVSGPLVKLLMELMKFGVAAFKIGKTIEGQFDQTAEEITKAIANPPPPPPNPEMMKVQADAQLQQAKLQTEQQMEAMRMQAEKERATLQDQIDRDRAQADAIAKQNEMQQEMALERLKAEMQMQIDRERQQSKVRFNQWKAELDARTKIEIAEIQAGVAIQNSQATAASQAAKDQKVSEEKNATLGVMQK